VQVEDDKAAISTLTGQLGFAQDEAKSLSKELGMTLLAPRSFPNDIIYKCQRMSPGIPE